MIRSKTMTARNQKLSLLLVLSTTFALGACVTSKNFSAGEQAEQFGRYDEAVNYYTRALAEDPGNPEYRQSLGRVKVRASHAHAMVAHKLRAAGDLHAAREEMELALAFNPADNNLATELERIVIAIREGTEAAAASSIAEIKRQARETPLGKLSLNPEATMPSGFVFRDASLRDILISVGKMAGVNVVFDIAFVDQPISIELRDTTFEEALGSLCKITNNFYLVHSDKIITVAPDTPAKRREYEQQVTKTFYLSTADLKETIDVLRIVLGARRVAPHTPTNWSSSRSTATNWTSTASSSAQPWRDKKESPPPWYRRTGRWINPSIRAPTSS
jgi:general secretion pathway protein D